MDSNLKYQVCIFNKWARKSMKYIKIAKNAQGIKSSVFNYNRNTLGESHLKPRSCCFYVGNSTILCTKKTRGVSVTSVTYAIPLKLRVLTIRGLEANAKSCQLTLILVRTDSTKPLSSKKLVLSSPT